MKKNIILVILILLVSGCSDPYTDNVKNNINMIKDLNKEQRVSSANNYIEAVKTAYTNYYIQNGKAPTSVIDLNIVYYGDLTGICNTDPTSSEYSVKIVDGYIKVYCGEYATYDGNDMPIY